MEQKGMELLIQGKVFTSGRSPPSNSEARANLSRGSSETVKELSLDFVLPLSLSSQELRALPCLISLIFTPFKAAGVYCHLYFQDEGTEMWVQVNGLPSVIRSMSQHQLGMRSKASHWRPWEDTWRLFTQPESMRACKVALPNKVRVLWKEGKEQNPSPTHSIRLLTLEIFFI